MILQQQKAQGFNLIAVRQSPSASALYATSRRTVAAASTSTAALPDRTTTASIAQRLPRTKASMEKRRQAYKAMNRKKVEKALTGVDAQMLELFSGDQFLYAPQAAKAAAVARTTRPKGRPEYVPGAMNYETLVKFRERQEVIEYVAAESSPALSPASDPEIAAVSPYLLASGESSATTDTDVVAVKATTAKSTAQNGVKSKGQAPSSEPKSDSLPIAGAPQKPRKRVIKNLPRPKVESTAEMQGLKIDSFTADRASKNPTMQLQKYYSTDLLSADEEYSLGMKIQFMVKCEQVHEGIAVKLGRLPTFEEWANACGFTEPDPTFIATEADEQLRPAGSESLFEETDPGMFVGNGLAQDSGPGRGRGRAKKPPPTKLADFYDDSEYQALKRLGKGDAKVPRRKKLQPINRGTVTDFVELLMTGREAKQQMVQGNMRLVVSIARKYSKVGVGLQDLVQEGSLGLSRAAEKFEPKKGFKFR